MFFGLAGKKVLVSVNRKGQHQAGFSGLRILASWTGSTRFVFVSCKHEPARSDWQSPLANARYVAYNALATCRPEGVICTPEHTEGRGGWRAGGRGSSSDEEKHK